jgi:aconitase (EC 4.2.1.3)
LIFTSSDPGDPHASQTRQRHARPRLRQNPQNLQDRLGQVRIVLFPAALAKELGTDLSRLPVSIRIVLESVLRNCDGKKVSAEHVKQVANWKPNAARTDEIPSSSRA